MKMAYENVHVLQMDIFINHKLQIDIFINHELQMEIFINHLLQMDIFLNHVLQMDIFTSHVLQMDIFINQALQMKTILINHVLQMDILKKHFHKPCPSEEEKIHKPCKPRNPHESPTKPYCQTKDSISWSSLPTSALCRLRLCNSLHQWAKHQDSGV